MGRQVICPGVVACGVEVHAVLGGIIIDLTAVGGVGQYLADVDVVAALAQRHISQQVIDGGNAGVVQAGLGCHDILLHAGDGLDVELDAGVKLFSQHIDQALIVGKEAVLTALHNKVVGADKDVEVVRLAGDNGLHRRFRRAGDGVLDADVVDKGLHARADVGRIVGVVVAGAVNAQARGNAVPREGHGVEVVLRHSAQHRHSHHAMVGVQVFGVDGLFNGVGLVPHGGIHSLHDALRLGDGGGRGGRCLGGRGSGLRRGGHRLCRGGGRRRTAVLEPEEPSPSAEQRQNYDEHQKHFPLAPFAGDLIAVGIEISHRSSHLYLKNIYGYYTPQSAPVQVGPQNFTEPGGICRKNKLDAFPLCLYNVGKNNRDQLSQNGGPALWHG